MLSFKVAAALLPVYIHVDRSDCFLQRNSFFFHTIYVVLKF